MITESTPLQRSYFKWIQRVATSFWNPSRLKRRKQLKPSQSEKNANEQNPAIISCPDVAKDNDANNQTEVQRITSTLPAGSGQTSMKSFPGYTHLYNLRASRVG